MDCYPATIFVVADIRFLIKVKKYVNESVLVGYATLGITVTTSLESALVGVLQETKLDLEGRLVKLTTVQSAFPLHSIT